MSPFWSDPLAKHQNFSSHFRGLCSSFCQSTACQVTEYPYGRCHQWRLKRDEASIAFHHFINFSSLQHSPGLPMCRPNSDAWAVAAVFGRAITSSILTACLDLQERIRDWRDRAGSVISTFCLPCPGTMYHFHGEFWAPAICDRTEMQEKAEWQCTECTRLLIEILQLFELLPCFQGLQMLAGLTLCFPQVTYHLVANLDKPAFKAYCIWKAYGEAGTVRHIGATAHGYVLNDFQVP